jgi:hypothetical protein
MKPLALRYSDQAAEQFHLAFLSCLKILSMVVYFESFTPDQRKEMREYYIEVLATDMAQY